MRDQDAHTWKVVVAKLPPQALVEAADSVVSICSALAIRYTVEEVPIIGPLLPHALHFCRAWLEVAKVLFSQSRLFVDGYLVAREGRGRGVIRGQRAEDAFGRFTCSAIRRGEELDRVVWLEERAKLSASVFGLSDVACKSSSL
jgi:hypothetical protein